MLGTAVFLKQIVVRTVYATFFSYNILIHCLFFRQKCVSVLYRLQVRKEISRLPSKITLFFDGCAANLYEMWASVGMEGGGVGNGGLSILTYQSPKYGRSKVG